MTNRELERAGACLCPCMFINSGIEHASMVIILKAVCEKSVLMCGFASRQSCNRFISLVYEKNV